MAPSRRVDPTEPKAVDTQGPPTLGRSTARDAAAHQRNGVRGRSGSSVGRAGIENPRVGVRFPPDHFEVEPTCTPSAQLLRSERTELATTSGSGDGPQEQRAQHERPTPAQRVAPRTQSGAAPPQTPTPVRDVGTRSAAAALGACVTLAADAPSLSAQPRHADASPDGTPALRTNASASPLLRPVSTIARSAPRSTRTTCPRCVVSSIARRSAANGL